MVKTLIVVVALLAMIIVPVWSVLTHGPGAVSVAVGTYDHHAHAQPEDRSGTSLLHGLHDASDHEQPGYAARGIAGRMFRAPRQVRSLADGLSFPDTHGEGLRRPPRNLSA